MPPAKNPLQKLLDLAGKYATSHKGEWGHPEWEKLLKDVEGLGFDVSSDETRRNLGNILEGSKYFYHTMPPTPKRPPRTARKKAG